MELFHWKILFYETERGDQPVYEFFIEQQPQVQSKITHLIDLLSQYGNMMGLPHSKALGGGLYELRIRGKKEIRIFYCFTGEKTIYLLHVFKKQTQQTPKKEMTIAIERMKEVKIVG